MSIANIFIRELKVENYKSLKKSKISLQKGLNFIIGKNGAGKSNVLEFIYLYASRNYFGMRQVPKPLNTKFQVVLEYLENDQNGSLKLSIDKIKNNDLFPESNYLYEVTFNETIGTKKVISNQKFTVGGQNTKSFLEVRETYRKEFQILRGVRRTYIKFQFPEDPFWITKPTKFIVDESNDVTFEDSDYSFNLCTELELSIETDLFKTITKRTKTNKTALKKAILKYLSNVIENADVNAVLKEYSPIEKIRINPNINIYTNGKLVIVENLSIDFFVEGNWMPWSYLSDGTKRLFYILTEVISFDSGIILVEEPELGIHPHQLFRILQFLKDQSLEKQIIISTHSPSALDILNADELDRITIAEFDNGTKFTKLTKAQIEKARKYMKDVGDFSSYWLHSDLEK
jgi:AAA15 family ATPase/GTPase